MSVNLQNRPPTPYKTVWSVITAYICVRLLPPSNSSNRWSTVWTLKHYQEVRKKKKKCSLVSFSSIFACVLDLRIKLSKSRSLKLVYKKFWKAVTTRRHGHDQVAKSISGFHNHAQNVRARYQSEAELPWRATLLYKHDGRMESADCLGPKRRWKSRGASRIYEDLAYEI